MALPPAARKAPASASGMGSKQRTRTSCITTPSSHSWIFKCIFLKNSHSLGLFSFIAINSPDFRRVPDLVRCESRFRSENSRQKRAREIWEMSSTWVTLIRVFCNIYLIFFSFRHWSPIAPNTTNMTASFAFENRRPHCRPSRPVGQSVSGPGIAARSCSLAAVSDTDCP